MQTYNFTVRSNKIEMLQHYISTLFQTHRSWRRPRNLRWLKLQWVNEIWQATINNNNIQHIIAQHNHRLCNSLVDRFAISYLMTKYTGVINCVKYWFLFFLVCIIDCHDMFRACKKYSVICFATVLLHAVFLYPECQESCSGNGKSASVCQDNTYYVQCRNGNPSVRRCGQHEVFVPSSARCGKLIMQTYIFTFRSNKILVLYCVSTTLFRKRAKVVELKQYVARTLI